jgi:hypothetical protein
MDKENRFKTDYAREIRLRKAAGTEGKIKRVGTGESNLNLELGYSTMGVGAIKIPSSELHGGTKKE